MKTPRELFLEKHRSAEAKLAALRGEDLARLARQQPSAVARTSQSAVSQVSQPACRKSTRRLPIWKSIIPQIGSFWRESIHPWRRAWAGMAAAWVGILALHLATIDRPETAGSCAAKPDVETQMVLTEQRQLLAELLAPAAPPPLSPPRPHGPRSDLRREQVIVYEPQPGYLRLPA